MTDGLLIILDMVSQVTGGRGGIDHVIVNYVVAGIFYALLLGACLAKHKAWPSERERLLVWGFGFGLARELFMISMATIQALGFVSHDDLHVIFPPLEHTLLDLSLILVGGAYIRYLISEELAVKYLRTGVIVTVCCYLTTFSWWASYIKANPSSKFGQVWPDWVFHINSSGWCLVAAIIFFRGSAVRTRKLVVTAFMFFFVAEVLKLPDMALDEVYENIFTPIARIFYLSAIPIFGYVYLSEILLERGSYLAQIEQKVIERTKELDSTLQKLSEANENLTKSNIELEKLNVIKNRFVGMAAHDLRNPLGVIRGYCTFMLEEHNPGPLKRFLVKIEKSANFMLGLVTNLLDLTHLESGKIVLELSQVELNNFIEEAVELNQMFAAKKDIEILFTSKEPVKVTVDSQKLEQVINNLVGNAVKFSPPGSKVWVELAEFDAQVVCSVTDQGPGVPPDEVGKLFKPFGRTSVKASAGEASTGLGLAIVKQIIEGHGGEIGMEPAQPNGCKFFFSLPKSGPVGTRSPKLSL